jgi:hypothetical protein
MEKVDDKGDGVKEELPSERMHVDEGAGEGMYMGPARFSPCLPYACVLSSLCLLSAHGVWRRRCDNSYKTYKQR